MTNNKSSAAKELAVKVLTLYKLSPSGTTNTDAIIDELYDSEATFQDPMVTANGIENVKAQFRALSLIFRETHVQFHRGAMSGPSLTIDSTVQFQPKFLPRFFAVQIRIFTICELRDGKIINHTDHWSLQTVIGSIPVVGWFYDRVRPVVGNVSSVIFKRIKPPQDKPHEQ